MRPCIRRTMAFAAIHAANFMVPAVLRAGIQLGMAQTQAQLCGVEIRRRSRALEKAAHAALLDLGWSMSPRVEDHAQDTILADLAGLNSLFGAEEDIAREFAR